MTVCKKIVIIDWAVRCKWFGWEKLSEFESIIIGLLFIEELYLDPLSGKSRWNSCRLTLISDPDLGELRQLIGHLIRHNTNSPFGFPFYFLHGCIIPGKYPFKMTGRYLSSFNIIIYIQYREYTNGASDIYSYTISILPPFLISWLIFIFMLTSREKISEWGKPNTWN